MSITQETQSSWRDDVNDMPHRREVIRLITKVLEGRKPNPSPKWLKELPYKAKKLEEHLYRTATSLEEYVDEKTLKQRLKKAALSIARHFRIEKAYKDGAWSRPSPRNSIIRNTSESGISVQSRRSTGSLADAWRLPHVPETSTSSHSFWDVSGVASAPTRSSSLFDVVSKDPTVPTSHVVVPKASVEELQELQRANRQLQDEILNNIRKQQEALRAMSTQSIGIERQSSSSAPHVVPV